MRWFTVFDGGETGSWYLWARSNARDVNYNIMQNLPMLHLLDIFILCVGKYPNTKYERTSSSLSVKLRIYFSPNHGAAWLNLIPRGKMSIDVKFQSQSMAVKPLSPRTADVGPRRCSGKKLEESAKSAEYIFNLEYLNGISSNNDYQWLPAEGLSAYFITAVPHYCECFAILWENVGCPWGKS